VIEDAVETTHVGWPTEVTRKQPAPGVPAAPAAAPSRPVLGFVVVYSRTAETARNADAARPGADAASTADRDPRLGRLIPLCKGDVFYAGRPPAPATVTRSDGQAVPPAATHLFPSTPEF